MHITYFTNRKWINRDNGGSQKVYNYETDKSLPIYNMISAEN